jgi:phosphoribosylglycinamide formyltransferase-1
LSPQKNKAKVLVLASGGGTTFEALALFSKTPTAAFDVMGMVTNNPQAGALARAAGLKIPSFVFSHDRAQVEKFFENVVETAKDLSVDVIALAGFLLLVREPLLSAYRGRILNTHPSLLPHFGGKGMYGERVHQAVIAAGHKESGVTVHLVNEKYDEGKVLGRVRVPVTETDDFHSLAERVRKEEKTLYPEILNQFVTSQGFHG